MSFKNEAEAMLTGINVDRMNEIVWTDDLVWSLWSDAVDGDCHLYPVDRLRICDTMCQKGGNKPRTVMLCSTMSNSLGPPGLQLTRLFYPWNFFFFFWQEYWSGLPFPPPQGLPDPGIKPMSLASAALSGRFFTIKLPGKPQESGVACPKMEQQGICY